MNKMKGKPEDRKWFLYAVPAAFAAGVANVMLFFLFMVVYGHVINPGHQESYYQEAAGRFGPYASIVGGIPIMYITGRILRGLLGNNAVKAGIAAWAVYLAVDLAILVAVGQFTSFLPQIAVSFVTKLAAVCFGARPRKIQTDGEFI